MLVVGCSNPKLIANEQTQAKIKARLTERTWLPALPTRITPAQREAMEFLYAYMPVGDVADYPSELFVSGVDASIKAKEQMSWGKKVPEDLFLHFVLPLRVNNETLDTSRVTFYNELKDRVKGLSMKDAILEVNHWCHEKVVYTPSDSRTSSPSACVRSASGRCGEESTFTVSALRAVGIPARQIYTPRWAHTDDNHAWVEAWADGTWYYIGACEPEPVLNSGWFDAPVKRGLIMFTKVFGDYEGVEEQIAKTDGYTEINVTQNYAPVKKTYVKVTDTTGAAVADAEVIYTIYNYAEFFPAVRKKSDSVGIAFVSSGLGDMVVWAKKGEQFGYAKLDVRTMDTLNIVLDKTGKNGYNFITDITPPAEGVVDNGVTAEQRELNNKRWAQEDSIRGAYVSTFMPREASNALAVELGLDTTKVWNFISGSRGNHGAIVEFLKNTPKEQLPMAMELLGVISAKDLRDTPSEVLADHLSGAAQYSGRPFFAEYILNPRIDDELLTPYRETLASKEVDSVAQALVLFDSLTVADNLNPAKLAISPMGVERLKIADGKGAERYLIALLRSNGIAARREPITERLQYYDTLVKAWQPLLKQEQSVAIAKGKVNVVLEANNYINNPKFYTHFSIAKLNNGEYHPLDFSSSVAADMGEGVSYKSLFAKPLELEVGDYQLITGTRMADGSVLSRVDYFNVLAEKTTQVSMVMRESENKLQVIGNIDPEALYIPEGVSQAKSILSTTGRGYFILALMDAKKEPTTHMLRQMQNVKAKLEQWGRPIVLVLPNGEAMQGFNKGEFSTLPATVSYGDDRNGTTANMFKEMLKVKDMSKLPVLVVADSFGRVIYQSVGYNTSLGEHLSLIIDALNNGSVIE